MTTPAPLVSCLCVTHDRVPLLRGAVACFQAQNWPSRELLILHEPRDHATAAYAASLDDPRIRTIVFPAGPRITLGEKRNIALAAAGGAYIATWDDDDWSSPARLASQMEVLAQSGVPACTLRNVFVFDAVGGRAYLSKSRPWEPTLVALREAMPPYPAVATGEDFPAVEAFSLAGRLAVLPQPQLYIYNFHGRNTVNRVHIRRNILAHAAPLAEEGRRLIADTLRRPGMPGPALDRLLATLEPGALRP